MNPDSSGSSPVFNFGHNTVGGDQIVQSGQGNIAKVDRRSAPTNSTIGVVDSSQAIAELTEFLARLERSAVIAPDGQISDRNALEESVVREKSLLGKVARALAAGGYELLANAVHTAATPAVLQLIDRYVT